MITFFCSVILRSPISDGVVATTSTFADYFVPKSGQSHSQVGNWFQEIPVLQVSCYTVTLGSPEAPHFPVSPIHPWVVVFAVWVAWFCVCPPLSENNWCLRVFWVCLEGLYIAWPCCISHHIPCSPSHHFIFTCLLIGLCYAKGKREPTKAPPFPGGSGGK